MRINYIKLIFKNLIILSSLGLIACNAGMSTTENTQNASTSGIQESNKLVSSNQTTNMAIQFAVTDQYMFKLTNQNQLFWANISNNRFIQSDYSFPNQITSLKALQNELCLGDIKGNIYCTNNNTFNFFQKLTVNKPVAIYSIAKNDTGQILAVGYGGNVFLQTTENEFQNISLNGYSLYSITQNGSDIIAVGGSGTIWVSHDDGVHWQQSNVPGLKYNLNQVYYNQQNGYFYTVGDTGVALYSKDRGNTWSYLKIAGNYNFNNITSLNSMLVVSGSAGFVASSTDGGLNWNKTVAENYVKFSGCNSSSCYIMRYNTVSNYTPQGLGNPNQLIDAYQLNVVIDNNNQDNVNLSIAGLNTTTCPNLVPGKQFCSFLFPLENESTTPTTIYTIVKNSQNTYCTLPTTPEQIQSNGANLNNCKVSITYYHPFTAYGESCVMDSVDGHVWAESTSTPYQFDDTSAYLQKLDDNDTCGFSSGWRLPTESEAARDIFQNADKVTPYNYIALWFNNVNSKSVFWTSSVYDPQHNFLFYLQDDYCGWLGCVGLYQVPEQILAVH